MTNKILHKRSLVPNRIPTLADIGYGELAMNSHDVKLFIRNASNQIVTVNSWESIHNKPVGLAAGSTANTPNTVALRDSNGDFSAGTITANLAGNALTATSLLTPRSIAGKTFDGTQDVTLSSLSAGDYLVGGPFNGSATVSWSVNASASTAANTIVARDVSGNFAANTITASLVGNSSTSTTLQTARTIQATGDATWQVEFDGSANASATLTLSNSGVAAGTYAKVTVDSKGRVTTGSNLLAVDIPDITAAKVTDFHQAVRTSGLDQMAAPVSNVSLNSRRVVNLAEPIDSQDAATKNYVDMAVQGLDPKQSVRVATTGNITLSGLQTIDGVMIADGDRVLVKDQLTLAQNGVYVVSSSSWTRAEDVNTWEELVSAFLFVEEGSQNADNGYLCTVNAGGTLGSDPVVFVQFSGAGQIQAGHGLTKTGNTLDVLVGNGIGIESDTVQLSGQALALHNLATNGIIVRSGTATVIARTIAAGTTGISVTDGNAVSGNPTISLSSSLSTIGALTPAANNIAYYNGGSTAALTSLTAYGRSIIATADAAAARTTLALGSIATQNANSVAITGGSLSGVSGSSLTLTNSTFTNGSMNGTTLTGVTVSASTLQNNAISDGTMSNVAVTGGTIDMVVIDGGSY